MSNRKERKGILSCGKFKIYPLINDFNTVQNKLKSCDNRRGVAASAEVSFGRHVTSITKLTYEIQKLFQKEF